ncbi:MAG: energy-coupling factor transporter ATPase [Coriobacteriia bacterium]|nr:energy-coupling factor transporter ATPase [Coriobacteriia bacterium]
MIRFDGVSFSYPTPSGGIQALDDVDLTLSEGEYVVVLGENGSGKSTLVRLINGLLAPGAGEVTVDGFTTSAEADVWEIRRRVGMVFQNPDNQIVATFVEEDVAFGPENLGVPRDELRRRVTSALQAVGLEGFERREPHQLSGGQKQRLAIAGALAMEPDYLVLDEPTAMLDPQGRADVLGVLHRLRERGRCIVHVTHDLSDAAQADRVVVMRRGRIVFDGTPEELLGNAALLAEYGLTQPAIGVLAQSLRESGVDVPATALDVARVVNALWPSS